PWSPGPPAGSPLARTSPTRPAKPRRSASMMWPSTSLTHHSPGAGCQEAAPSVSAADSARRASMEARSSAAISLGENAGGENAGVVGVGSAGMDTSVDPRVTDGMPGVGHDQRGGAGRLVGIGRELLEGDAAEARAKGAAADTGIQVAALGLEAGGIERLRKPAGEDHLRPAQAAARRLEATPLG